jgi:hypothetical protein
VAEIRVEPVEFASLPFIPMGGIQMVTHTRVTMPDAQGNPQTKVWVQLIFTSHDVHFSYFMDAEMAEKFADDIRLHARQARSGIQIAKDIPNIGNGHRA